MVNNKMEEKRARRGKSELYIEERSNLLKEIEEKMNLSETNRSVLLSDLEGNEELKEFLKSKVDIIKKMYVSSKWNYFVNQHSKEPVDEISLLKSIMKSENYVITNRKKVKTIDEKKRILTELYFTKVM